MPAGDTVTCCVLHLILFFVMPLKKAVIEVAI